MDPRVSRSSDARPGKIVLDPKALVVPERFPTGYRFASPWGVFVSETTDLGDSWQHFDSWTVETIRGNPAAKAVLEKLIDVYGIEVPIGDLDDPMLSAAWNRLRSVSVAGIVAEGITGTVLAGDPWSATTAAAMVVVQQFGLVLVAKLSMPEEEFVGLGGSVVPLPALITFECGQVASVEQALSVRNPGRS